MPRQAVGSEADDGSVRPLQDARQQGAHRFIEHVRAPPYVAADDGVELEADDAGQIDLGAVDRPLVLAEEDDSVHIS